MNFNGKTAVIAGDAWGLGRATTLMFAREGASFISGAIIVVDGGRTATTQGCYEEL